MRGTATVLALLLAIGLATAAGPSDYLAAPQAGVFGRVPIQGSSISVLAPNGDWVDAETLHWDSGEPVNAIGLTSGGVFRVAARFTPDVACTLKTVIHHHWDPTNNAYIVVYGPGTSTTPGAALDSVPYTGADTGWQAVAWTGDGLALPGGSDFWLSIWHNHAAGVFPASMDGGPMVRDRGGFIQADVIGPDWQQIADLGYDGNWSIRAVISAGAGPAHDVGVVEILDPQANVNPVPVAPRGTIRNFGSNPESDIPVYCFIDSAGTEVYGEMETYAGPLAPGATAEVVFTPDWAPGPAGAEYEVEMYTELTADEQRANDTSYRTVRVAGAIFSDTIIAARIGSFAPVIDGMISPGEWDMAQAYDISDLAGRGGSGARPAGSCIMWHMYDAVNFYYACDVPPVTLMEDYDQIGPYVDEDRSLTWSTDSSEGNHWLYWLTGAAAVIYRSLPDYTQNPNPPGCVYMQSIASGHLQMEAQIPLGSRHSDYTVAAGDTVGYRNYMTTYPGTTYWGWWPQSLLSTQWADPAYYGVMILDTTLVSIEEVGQLPLRCVIVATPSLVHDLGRITYSVSREARVSVGVYDAAGSLVRSLEDGVVQPGVRTATWDRTDNRGCRVANGTYFYRVEADGKSFSSKAVVLN